MLLSKLASELAFAPVEGVAPTFRRENARAQVLTDRTWMLSGPAETGKTWAALWRLDSEARKHPNSQWLLVRKIRATMDSTVLKTWKKIIAIRGGAIPFGGEKPQWYDYKNGARIWVVGFDNPDKILSGEFDGAVVNQAEELDEPDFETLTTRCTGRGAVTSTPMVWGDCNPGPEDHWIQRRKHSGSLSLLETTHEDNPTLYDEQGWTAQGLLSLATLDRLTGVRYQRLRLGRWVGAEGQYFRELDEARHLLTFARVPPGWQVWGALDYGFVHPLSFGVFGYHEGAGVVLLGRHAAHHWYVKQHAVAMDGLLSALGIQKKGLRIVAGHDCWATGKDDPETIADKFKAKGYVLERAVIDRVNGARAVGERLGKAEAGLIPSLFFNELHGGRAVFTALSRVVHDPHDAEDVLKVNADAEGRGGDDDYDMCRYGVMAAPTGKGWDKTALGALSSGQRV